MTNSNAGPDRNSVPGSWTDLKLIQAMLEFQGTILLRNEFGTTELRGDDLTLKCTDRWLTIYHGRAENSERMSHIHLRRDVFGFAHILEREGGTSQLAFWKRESDARGAAEISMESGAGGDAPPIKPPFAIFFAPFYDWSGPEKRELQDNRARCLAWIEKHGREFNL